MKLLLAAMCGIMVLFMGGCAVTMFAQSGPFFIPAAIAFLNVFILGALFHWNLKWHPAFYILGVADFLVAAGVFMFVAYFSGGMQIIVAVVAIAFVLKGILSLRYGLKLGKTE